MMPMFLTVYLSNNDQHYTEVPLTPDTLCRDIIDLCKEPGETQCYLAEMWRGAERGISDGESIMDILQRWGQQRGEVRFYLRHNGGQRAPEVPPKRGSLKTNTERRMENGLAPPTMNATLAELQEMASRQQQQINAQQQLLASKEQRLRYLKQQQQQQQQQVSDEETEQDKLRLLRENAENQESKLRRVRALRGQVEQKRITNSKLVEEIEQMRGLFHQKQRELLLAASRVDELSSQLEAIRKGGTDPQGQGQGQGSHAAVAADLERLYKELQLRNRLNQEQSARLGHQRELLSKRSSEVSAMDKRISELRQRLGKKKAALHHKENLPPPAEGLQPSQHPLGSRVAAVEPYIQQTAMPSPPPVPPRQEVLNKPRPPHSTATLPLPNGPIKSQHRPPAKPHTVKAKLSDGSSESSGHHGYPSDHRGYSSTLPRMASHPPLDTADSDADLKPPPLPLRRNQSSEDLLRDKQSGKPLPRAPPPIPSKPKAPPPAPPTSTSSSSFSRFATGTFPGRARPLVVSHQSEGGGATGGRHTLRANADPAPPTLTPAATVHPFTHDVDGPLATVIKEARDSSGGSGGGLTGVTSGNTPPLSRPQTVAASSIYSMYTQHSGTLPRSHPRVYGKPVLPSSGGQHSNSNPNNSSSSSTAGPPEQPHTSSATNGSSSSSSSSSTSSDAPGPVTMETERSPRPLSPTKLLPFLSCLQGFRGQSDGDLESLRRRLQHAPRPLKKRSSITEPEGPAGPNIHIHKLLYQRATLAAMETSSHGNEAASIRTGGVVTSGGGGVGVNSIISSGSGGVGVNSVISTSVGSGGSSIISAPAAMETNCHGNSGNISTGGGGSSNGTFFQPPLLPPPLHQDSHGTRTDEVVVGMAPNTMRDVMMDHTTGDRSIVMESPCTIIPENTEEEEEYQLEDQTPPPLPPRSPIVQHPSLGRLPPPRPPTALLRPETETETETEGEDEGDRDRGAASELHPRFGSRFGAGCGPGPGSGSGLLEGYMGEYPPYPPPPYPVSQATVSQDTAELQGPEMGGGDGIDAAEQHAVPEVTMETTLPPGKRTNLRKVGSERISHGMRVRFNPLSLLLDASLEGEYDLVQRIIYEVEDPSLPNDEGITALHNAVCAGHTDIVNFLVQFGVNVNAADSDGWTPLHCAASCNNVQMCKFLVECGAAVFAVTTSDMQTPADKCEEMEEGYAQCSQFLYGVQEKMGVMNRGLVYGLWDYDAEAPDELSFREGDALRVLQRSQEQEQEEEEEQQQEEEHWWWAQCGDQEGYIPRNLLGLYLRIKPRQRSLA